MATTASQLLDAVETALINIVSGEVSAYDIDTGDGKRTFTKHNVRDLMALRDQLKQEVVAGTARRVGVGVIRGVGA